MNQTTKKRIIITIIFTLIFIVTGFLLYLAVAPNATCFDSKQNQAEKGIDCGGPCTPCKASMQTVDIITQEVTFVEGGNNTFDVLAKIYNPNDAVGAKSFDYNFTLKDSSGAIIATRSGKSFILPVDTKYIVQLGIETENNVIPKSVEIKINNPEWAELKDIQKPQLGVYNKKFDKAPMGNGSQAEGIVRNESGYDLNKIMLVVVLRDAFGRVVGINSTEKNMVRVREQQDFRLNWPYALPGNVQKMEVDVQSNVLDMQNFSVEKK